MQIKLAKKTAIWGLRDSDIFLTFANPGPVEVEWDTLSELQKMALRNALAANKVIRADGGDIPTIEQPKKKEKAVEPKQKAVDNSSINKEAKSLLSKKVGAIKVEINKISDVNILMAALTMESRKSRPRKKVVNMLEEALSSILQKENTTGAKKNDIDFDIQEEETETIVKIDLEEGKVVRESK